MDVKYVPSYEAESRNLRLFAFIYDEDRAKLEAIYHHIEKRKPNNGMWVIAYYDKWQDCPRPVEGMGCVAVCFELDSVDNNLNLLRGINGVFMVAVNSMTESCLGDLIINRLFDTL